MRVEGFGKRSLNGLPLGLFRVLYGFGVISSFGVQGF